MTMTRRNILFLLIYPLIHMAAIGLCFFVSDLIGHMTLLAEVVFMFVLLLIAPVLAFPGTLEELVHLVDGWPAAAVFILVYVLIMVFYAAPLLWLFKASRSRRLKPAKD
jgi:hypothetical protein